MILKSLASFLVLSTGCAWGSRLLHRIQPPGRRPSRRSRSSSIVTAIDKTADPCTDFYQFACGNWKKNNPIPADQTRWGRFNELAERNNYLLYQDLKAAADAPKTPLQKKYGDYFAACMNVELADKLGAKPMEPVLKAIAALQDKKDLSAMVAKCRRYALGVFYTIRVRPGPEGLDQQIVNAGRAASRCRTARTTSTTMPRSQKLRDQYVDHLTKMFMLLGDTPDKAAAEAKNVMAIETALAKGAIDRVELRDPAKRYHIMTKAELQALSPNYDWNAYLKGIKMASSRR